MKENKEQLKIIQREINALLEEILTLGLDQEVVIVTDKNTGNILRWDFEDEKLSYINEECTKMPIFEALCYLEFLYKMNKKPDADAEKLDIASEITACRHCLGFTQKKFAEALNLAPRRLEEWESGIYVPSALVYKKIKNYFSQNFKFGKDLLGVPPVVMD